MSAWYRVFGANTAQPEPAELLELLRERGITLKASISGDQDGWYQAKLVDEADGSCLMVERYLAEEEGIRQQFNTWAAWIESNNSAKEGLMERIINTRQLFTIQPPAGRADKPGVQDVCRELARFFAQLTDGVYQIDDQGIFAADGELLLEEF
jgi:hypothetical protein